MYVLVLFGSQLSLLAVLVRSSQEPSYLDGACVL